MSRSWLLSAAPWALLAVGGSTACTPLVGLDHDYYVVSSSAGAAQGGASGQAGTSSQSGAGAQAGTTSPGGAAGIPDELPPGKLVYHSYSTYEASDSQMFVVDLPGGAVSKELGAAFGICSPEAGTFSPDGTMLAVTARPMPVGGVCPTSMDRNDLEVYVLNLTTILDAAPTSIRVTNNTLPDEDPIFAPVSNFLLLKHNLHLVKWTLGSAPITTCEANTPGTFCFTSSGSEESKPGLTQDEMLLCYAEGSSGTSNEDIFCFDRAKGEAGADILTIAMPVATHAGVSDGRPSIAGDWLYYARWQSMTDTDRLLARKSLSNLLNAQEQVAAFTDTPTNPVVDYTDPFSLDGDLLVFGSDISGAGKHDLFVGTFGDTSIESLSQWVPSINTSKDELGPSFWTQPQ